MSEPKLIKVKVEQVRSLSSNQYWMVSDDLGRRYWVRVCDVSASNNSFWAWSHKLKDSL